MRLYSRSSVILAGTVGAIGSVILTLAAVWAVQSLTERSSVAAQVGQAVPSADAPPVTPVALDGTALTDEQENIRIYETLNEGVVNVSTQVLGYNWFLEAVPQEGGTGSGFIIDKKGYVVTNNHVIANADKITLTLADGAQFEATLVGKDVENDLAVLKFDPKGRNLVTLPLGSSQGLKVGTKVLAIGNPFALDRTMTTGIVSALGRPLRGDNGLVLHELIQTDASINPGNSGGPLLNSRGEVIGINTMIYSPTGGSVGIGFAVPVDTAKRVVPELLANGRVNRGWIDFTPVQLFPQLVRYANLPVDKGILVSKVTAGGQAAKAGLRGGDPNQGVRYGRTILYLGGDIIIGINGVEVAALADLYSALESTRPGDKVKVSLLRGGKPMELSITLVQRSEKDQLE
jgi:S1-C subfamily serine protease